MSLDPRIVDSLRRTVAMLHQIEEVLDRLDPDHDSELHEAIEHVDEVIERAEGNSTWREFIDEHPELTVPTRLEFTDEEVCDALVEIHAHEHGVGHLIPSRAKCANLLTELCRVRHSILGSG
jgi:hypothetical protein